MCKNFLGHMCRILFINCSIVHIWDISCGNTKLNSPFRANNLFNGNYNSLSLLPYLIINSDWIIKPTSHMVFSNRLSFHSNNYSKHSFVVYFSIRNTKVSSSAPLEKKSEIFNRTYLQARICGDGLSRKNRGLGVFQDKINNEVNSQCPSRGGGCTCTHTENSK
jgi:hypothetical protein